MTSGYTENVLAHLHSQEWFDSRLVYMLGAGDGNETTQSRVQSLDNLEHKAGIMIFI